MGGGLDCEAEECLTAVLYKIAELPTVEPPTPPPLYTEKQIWILRYFLLLIFENCVFLISTRLSRPNGSFAQT